MGGPKAKENQVGVVRVGWEQGRPGGLPEYRRGNQWPYQRQPECRQVDHRRGGRCHDNSLVGEGFDEAGGLEGVDIEWRVS